MTYPIDLSNRFKILKKIEQGGIGTVYRANSRKDGRSVAIKMLHPKFTGSVGILARFDREIDILKALSLYPEFPRFERRLELVVTDSKGVTGICPAFAMELLSGGQDAFDLIKNNAPFKDDFNARMIILTALALNNMHRLGIIHRDVKPENVYVQTQDGLPENVKVFDFNISGYSTEEQSSLQNLDQAKRVTSNGKRLIERKITFAGTIFGTPAYISPETIKDYITDRRSDLYSLGIVMYRMLVRRFPIRTDCLEHIMEDHLHCVPIHPGYVREIQRYDPTCLGDICLRLLEKDAEERYQNESELVVDILREVRLDQGFRRKVEKTLIA